MPFCQDLPWFKCEQIPYWFKGHHARSATWGTQISAIPALADSWAQSLGHFLSPQKQWFSPCSGENGFKDRDSGSTASSLGLL